MSKLSELLSKDTPVIFDGAMGTVLMQKGYGHHVAEKLNLSHPDIIKNIHQEYIDSGADIIETNTFNASPLKLREHNLLEQITEINNQAVKLAKKAAGNKALVAGSMGPTGKLLEPMGQTTFEEAYNNYKQQADILYKAGVDLFIIETISDIQEARAGLLAIKDICDLPVICSLTFNADGKTLTGTDIYTAAVTLKELGVSVFSINCSIGPDGVLDIYKNYYKKLGSLNIPLMVMPNAGLPVIENNQAVYKMTPLNFSDIMNNFRKYGVNIYGGCCGTTPAHIQELANNIKNKKISFHHSKKDEVYFTSRTKTISLSSAKPFLKIGETLNPTARKAFAEELKKGHDSFLRNQAKEQTKLGAHLLDINVGVPELDCKALMKKSVLTLSIITDTPLCLDSDNPEVLEEGLKNYPGIALINSVSGKKESLNKIVPLAKKYGANLIALALDENGIPEKSNFRLKIVNKILKYLKQYKYNINKLFIDGLVMSVSSNPEAPRETIKITKYLKQKGIKTSLGVSNVSFGLPERKHINNVFLTMLKKAGLSAGIINVMTYKPLKKFNKEESLAKAVLLGKDPGAKNYIAKIGNQTIIKNTVHNIKSGLEAIYEAVISGEDNTIINLIIPELNKYSAEDILEKALLPALEKVGTYYTDGKYYLPQMISSAKTMKKAFSFLKNKLSRKSLKSKGTVIICTVEGDIHDIGKNIVALMLENSGFNVIDLGKDVSAEKIIEAAKTNNAQIVLLSALLTTTMIKMKEVKDKLLAAGINIPVMVGGAVVNSDYANNIGADYSANAAEAVKLASKILSIKKGD